MEMPLLITLLILGVVKPLLILFVLLILVLFVRNKSASFQHFVLMLGMVGILLLPMISTFIPVISWHILPISENKNSAVSLMVNAIFALFSIELNKSTFLILSGIYIFIASWILFYFFLGVFGLYRQTLGEKSIEDAEMLLLSKSLCGLLDIHRPVKIIASPYISSPQMWGFIRPVILLPKTAVLWDYDKKLSVMIHELGHVRRYDWLAMVLVKITCALFWFLPPVWWTAKHIYQQAEIACDDFIYYLRDKHVAYAENLLAFGGAAHLQKNDDALGMMGHSALYERISAVLDGRRPRYSVPVESAQYWVLMGGFALSLMASLQLLPINTVMLLSHVDNGLNIQYSELGNKDDFLDDKATRKSFKWNELKKLQQQYPEKPVSLSVVESLKVVMPRPKHDLMDKHDLQSIDAAIKGSPPKPDIRIQGYLPVDIVVPEYPVLAMSRGIEGRVAVSFTIGINGEVLNPKIVSEYPPRIFSKTALKAISQSRYSPQYFDGQPVILQDVIEQFTFKLQPQTSNNRRR